MDVRINMLGVAKYGTEQTKVGTLQWNNDFDRTSADAPLGAPRDFLRSDGALLDQDNEVRGFSVVVATPDGSTVAGRFEFNYDPSELRVWQWSNA